MLETVAKLLKKQLRLPAQTVITADSKIKDDLGADSLDILQILVTLEEDYGIVIPDESLANFVSVGDIVAYLEKIGAHFA